MARRIMSLCGQWSSRVFSVEPSGTSAPVYFALQEDKPRGKAPELLRAMQRDERCYGLFVCLGDRIHRAKCYWVLRDKLLTELLPHCELLPMTSFLPDVKDSLLKGFFVKAAPDCTTLTEQVLGDLVENHPVLVCSYQPGTDGSPWSQHAWPLSETRLRLSDQYYVVECAAPDYQPSTLHIVNSDVFYSFEEAYRVLRECVHIVPESQAVLALADQRREARHKPDFPVIVIEGLDATGKTTLTESLREALGATLLRSPPQCLSPWRAAFDREPPLIRRAFYALGNYITAEQIGQEALLTPVIVDRYWHSTAAYAIATAVTGPVCNLPPKGSEVYRWPTDLLQPSLVVLLTLDPEERRKRLRGRGQGQTEEEQELAQNKLFRLRVEEAYQSISGPSCFTVDASPSADQVLQQVLLLIRDKCHL